MKKFQLLELEDLDKFSESILNGLDNIIKRHQNEALIYDNLGVEKLLHITANTLRKYREEGLKYFKDPKGEYRYRSSDIHQFIDDNTFCLTKLNKENISEYLMKYSTPATFSVNDDKNNEDTFHLIMKDNKWNCCVIYNYDSNRLHISMHQDLNKKDAEIITLYNGKCNNTGNLKFIITNCIDEFTILN